MIKRNFFKVALLLLTICSLGSCSNNSQSDSRVVNQETEITFETPEIADKSTVFYLVNDLGRNGYYEQKDIANLMGVMGEKVGPDFIVAAGDVHHFDGEIGRAHV